MNKEADLEKGQVALFQQEGYDLVGAAIEVYNQMGHGFLEEVYQECLEIELAMRGVPFEAQPSLGLDYKKRTLKRTYRPDLVVFGGIVVELKAVKSLTPIETAQLINYLRATKKRVGYLINFGNPAKLEWQRFVL